MLGVHNLRVAAVYIVTFVFALVMAFPEIEHVFADDGVGGPQEEARETEETSDENFEEHQNEETEAFEEETNEDGGHEVPGEEWWNEEEETEETSNETSELDEEGEDRHESEDREDQRDEEPYPDPHQNEERENEQENEYFTENLEQTAEEIAESGSEFGEWAAEYAENQEYEEEEEEEEGPWWSCADLGHTQYSDGAQGSGFQDDGMRALQRDLCAAQHITDGSDAPEVESVRDQVELLIDALTFEIAEK